MWSRCAIDDVKVWKEKGGEYRKESDRIERRVFLFKMDTMFNVTCSYIVSNSMSLYSFTDL